MKKTIISTAFKSMMVSMLCCMLAPLAALAYTVQSGRTINSGENWGAETHFVTGPITVANGACLTIQRGAVLKFAPGVQLQSYGCLNASGTETEPIIFTSRDDDTFGEMIDTSDGDPLPGDWHGIYLYGNGDNDGIGEFDYCRIRYGGASASTFSANLYFSDSDSGHFINSISEYSAWNGVRVSGASPQIADNLLENNAYHGLVIHNSSFSEVSGNVFNNNGNHGLVISASSLPVVSDNVFNNNGMYPIFVSQGVMPPGISGNSAAGHPIDTLVFSGTLNVNQTWSCDPAFPIVVLSIVTVGDGVTLTLAADTIVKFGTDAQLYVRGTLDVNGSTGSPVVLTALADDAYGGDTESDGDILPVPGAWHGVYLYGNGDNDGIGEFDYCRIRYGGASASTFSANLYFSDSDSGYFINSISEYSAWNGVRVSGASPQIADNLLENNAYHGLVIHNSSFSEVSGNVFNNNGMYPIFVSQGVMPPGISGNSAAGHPIDTLVFSGTLNVNQTWSCDPAFPIVLLSSVTVIDGVTLTLAAGTIVKFGPGTQFYVSGTLDVNGSGESPVVLTALADDAYGGDTESDGDIPPVPGAWHGVYMYGNGDNDGIGEFNYCRIRYGGDRATAFDANLYFSYSDSGYFINSVSEYSAWNGLGLDGASIRIVNSTLVNNQRFGVRDTFNDVTIANSIIWNNVSGAISGSPEVLFSDVQGGYTGTGNIDADPLFIDPTRDYRLDICSPAIDAGDPVEILSADYIAGELIVAVDHVTAIEPGEMIWITDGINFDSDDVLAASDATVTLTNGFFNAYAVADRSYLYTATSDYTYEPVPNGRRINMGAYGGGSEAVPSLVCRADLEGDDLDVDGADLAAFMGALGTSLGDADFNPDADFNNDGTVSLIDLAVFAEEFGRTDCPVCP